MCHWDTGVMVADNGPLYTYVDIPQRKSTVSSYNSYLQHYQCLHCISDQFDVILMDQKICFSFKNKDISKWPQTFEQ